MKSRENVYSAAERPDLNNGTALQAFLRQFYARVLADPQLAPIFLDAAAIDLERHLGVIESFWRKLLLAEPGYDRHMMNIHRDVHVRHHFTAADFERWLGYFEQTLDAGFQGLYTERARRLARSIATNLQEALLAPDDFTQRTRPIEHPHSH